MGLPWVFAAVGLVASAAGLRFAIRNRATPWTLKRIGWLVGGSAMLVLLTAVALRALDGVLARMHVPGIADRGLETFTGWQGLRYVYSSGWFLEVPRRWSEWQDGAGELFFARPAQTLATFLAIDSLVFIPAYCFLVSIVFARAIEKSGRVFANPQPPGGWERWLLGVRPGTPTDKRLTPLELGMCALVAAAVIADLAENLFLDRYVRLPLAANQDSSFNTYPLRAFVAVKVASLLIVVGYGIIPSALIVLFRAKVERRLPGKASWRLRALIVVVALFGLLVTNTTFQVPDSIRRWNPWQGIVTALIVIGFGLAVAWAARGLLRLERTSTHRPTRKQLLVGLGGLAVVIGLGWLFGHFPRGLLLPFIALFLLWALGYRLEETVAVSAGVAGDEQGAQLHWTLTRTDAESGAKALPALLGIAPPLFLAIATARSMLPQTVFNHPGSPWLQVLVFVISVVLPPVVLVFVYRFISDKVIAMEPSRRVRDTVRIVAIVTAVYVWWRVVAAPWSFPQAVGAVVLVALFLLFAGLFVAWLTRVELEHPPPLALGVFGFRQTPLLAFLLLWVALVIPFSRTDFHDVRLIDVAQPVAQVTPAQGVDRWFARTPDDGLIHPMVFVTANGGGIKAAVWAAMVLDCVLADGAAIHLDDVRTFCQRFNPNGEDRWASSVFAASGVSGGTLGLVTFDRLRARDPGNWLRIGLGDDFVSPSIAWQTFVEAPQTYLQWETSGQMDRAEVLERAWERATLERSTARQLWAAALGGDHGYEDVLSTPFLSAGGTEPQPPYLVFNGLSVEDGCRLEVSSIRFTPSGSVNCTSITHLDTAASPDEASVATRDVFPFLCDPATGATADVRASTAVTLAARFPVVSPSGRLVACILDNGLATHVHVVDGGYGDNSGGAAVASLWSAVAPTVDVDVQTVDPCAVPVLLEIDSGYGPTPASKKADVPELRVPIVGSSSAREVRTIEGRDAAALPFRRPFPSAPTVTDRQAIVYLRPNPEGEATLGWTMDDSTFDQMETQLVSNADQLAAVAAWFDQPCLALRPPDSGG